MAEFRFFLGLVEVEEPIGFDGVELSIRKSDEYSGLTFAFSDTLEFVGTGATILRDAFNTDGIDAVVAIEIRYCVAGAEDVLYIGTANFAVFSEKSSCPDDCSESVTVGIMQSGLTQRFKNRIDTPIDLSKTSGIDGNTLTIIEPFDLDMHSKLIKKESRFSINPLLQTQTYEIINSDNATPYLAVPFRLEYGDVDTSMEVLSFLGINTVYTNPILYTGFTYPPGITLRTIRVYGRLKVTVSCTAWGPGGAHFFVHLVARTVQDDTNIYFLPQELAGPGNFFISVTDVPQTVDISFDYTLELPPDCNLFLSTLFQSSIPSVQTYVFDEVTQLNLLEESLYPASVAKAYFVHEAFYRIAEAITGQNDCFRSDFFGGTTASVPYPADGCGRYLALTNGLNIRKMKDKNGELFPVTTSFKDLFDALSAIYSLGMRVEIEGVHEVIRVEPKRYFYNSDVSYLFKHVAEIDRSVALDLIYNEAEFGYQKWETEAKNGIDEFNSKHNYSLPIIQAKRKLSNICGFVTGGYAIELTRRLQFATDPTTDSSYDNENFLIACINAPIKVVEFRAEGNVVVIEGHHYFPSVTVSGSASNNGTFTTPANTFLSGTTELYADEAIVDETPTTAVIDQYVIRPEKDENFSTITNIISPETAYNLRLSPVRMLLNWYPIMAASMVKKTSPLIKFQSGTGNYLLSDERDDACDEGADGLLVENQDIAKEDVVELLQNPYYVPEYYQFSFPVSLRVFLQLKLKANQAISVGCENQIKAFLKEVTYQPNGDGGVATFKVVRCFEPD